MTRSRRENMAYIAVGVVFAFMVVYLSGKFVQLRRYEVDQN